MTPTFSDEVLDKLALLALEGAYSATFDSRDADGWSSLFTEDGSYESGEFARSPGQRPMVGREALKQACAGFPGNLVHILGIPDFRISGDSAFGRLNWTSAVSTETPEGASGRVTHGYYDVEYRRTSDGWAIFRRVSHAVVKTETQAGRPVTPPLWAK